MPRDLAVFSLSRMALRTLPKGVLTKRSMYTNMTAATRSMMSVAQ